MDTEIDFRNGVCSIRFNGDLTVYTVAERRSAVLDKCPTGCSATLDLSDVGKVDAAGLQFLLACESYFASGGGLTLSGIGESVRAALELTRLSDRFTEAVANSETE